MDKTFESIVASNWTQAEIDQATVDQSEAAFGSPQFSGLAKLVGYVFRHAVNGDMY